MASLRILAGILGIVGVLALASILRGRTPLSKVSVTPTGSAPLIEMTRIRDDFSQRAAPKDDPAAPDEPDAAFPESHESDG